MKLKCSKIKSTELLHFLNLTLIQVGEHQEALYEMDTRLIILNRTPMSSIKTFSYLRYPVVVLADVHTGVTWLTSGILSLKWNVNALYEYLHVIASHKMNSLIVLLVDLSNILVNIKHDIWKKTLYWNYQMTLIEISLHVFPLWK